jgi:hypothetical protein
MRCLSSGHNAVDLWSRESNREYGLPLSTDYLSGRSRNHVDLNNIHALPAT